VNSVETLAEECLPFSWIMDFAGLWRIRQQIQGFDQFFVKIKQFIGSSLLLADALADNCTNAFQSDCAARQIVAVNVSQDIFSNSQRNGIRLMGLGLMS